MSSGLALSRPLLLEDGRCLRTLADAGEMLLCLTTEEQAQPRWQAVVGALIFEMRNDQSDQDHVAATTDQLARALSEPPFGSVRLADSAAAPLAVAVSLPAVSLPAAPPPQSERPARFGVIAGCEFLSILAVVLTAGVMLLGRP